MSLAYGVRSYGSVWIERPADHGNGTKMSAMPLLIAYLTGQPTVSGD